MEMEKRKSAFYLCGSSLLLPDYNPIINILIGARTLFIDKGFNTHWCEQGPGVRCILSSAAFFS